MSYFKNYIQSINSVLGEGSISYDAATQKAEYIKGAIARSKTSATNSGVTYSITKENKHNLDKDLKVFNQFKVGKFTVKKHGGNFFNDGYTYAATYTFFEIREHKTQYFTSNSEVKVDILNDPRFSSYLGSQEIKDQIILQGVCSYSITSDIAVGLFKFLLKMDKLSNFI